MEKHISQRRAENHEELGMIAGNLYLNQLRDVREEGFQSFPRLAWLMVQPEMREAIRDLAEHNSRIDKRLQIRWPAVAQNAENYARGVLRGHDLLRGKLARIRALQELQAASAQELVARRQGDALNAILQADPNLRA